MPEAGEHFHKVPLHPGGIIPIPPMNCMAVYTNAAVALFINKKGDTGPCPNGYIIAFKRKTPAIAGVHVILSSTYYSMGGAGLS
jgi:hypothetical protein